MTGRLDAIAAKSGPKQAMRLLDRGEISREAGLASDWRGIAEGRQLTVVFAEDWTRTVAGLDPSASWTLRRANLLISGLPNPRAEGGVLATGSVRLRVTGATHPCSRMDQQLPGVRKALEPDWRGGLAAVVVEGGAIAVGDSVSWA